MTIEDLMMLELLQLNRCYSYQKLAMAHNGSQYFEPYSGTVLSTALTMQDIEVLKGDNRNMPNENNLLLSKCEQLQIQNQRLDGWEHLPEGKM